jgi:hypothetical protein
MKTLPIAGLLTVALLWAIVFPLRAQEIQLEVELSPPNDYFKVGEFKRIYDPSVGEKEPWYINDHCLIQEKESGKWHMFGITRQEPARPIEEIMFAHATADKLTQQSWKKEPHVLHVAREEPWKEVHVWAPHVVEHEGLYYMYYCAGGESNLKYRIHLAISPDLYNWTRHPANPMLIDGFDARDPMVRREGDKWVMYYTANRPIEEGNHVVVKVTSDDLVKWGDPKVVFTHSRIGKWGGPTESPYVVTRNGWHYLFICMNPPYDMTAVYRSRTPDKWEEKDKIGQVGAHCAEVVELPGDKWYVTRAGWGRGGLFLAELEWLEKADEEGNDEG